MLPRASTSASAAARAACGGWRVQRRARCGTHGASNSAWVPSFAIAKYPTGELVNPSKRTRGRLPRLPKTSPPSARPRETRRRRGLGGRVVQHGRRIAARRPMYNFRHCYGQRPSRATASRTLGRGTSALATGSTMLAHPRTSKALFEAAKLLESLQYNFLGRLLDLSCQEELVQNEVADVEAEDQVELANAREEVVEHLDEQVDALEMRELVVVDVDAQREE
mmetsp:Transcript_3497/g.14158  ORF Transcript_3497/g.14158 Transcript_3497/m.14158 type:complete len:223 (-) Transcript_3497:242-910(-)